MDAFYASIEQRDQPELRGQPVVVGGTGPRGVVSAASYEARVSGVRSAMPTAQARKLCPDAVFLRGDMPRYVRESKRIFEIFRTLTPKVEGLSLDEAFLDLTGSERLLGPAAQAAELLRARVRRETGLVVSCGLAPVKLVAKIASALAKPDGFIEVREDDVARFLEPLPVWRLWGVGPVARARLERLGIETVGELARSDAKRIEGALGNAGLELARLARGEGLRGDENEEVKSAREAVSLSEENTFERDVCDSRVLEAALRTHAEAVARRLRRSGLLARSVVLKCKLARRIKTGPRGFRLRTLRETLLEPSDDGADIAGAARRLLARAHIEEPLRLIGVGVTNLIPNESEQLSLLEPARAREQRRRLNRSLDEISERFGPGAVRRAAEDEIIRQAPSLQIKRGEAER